MPYVPLPPPAGVLVIPGASGTLSGVFIEDRGPSGVVFVQTQAGLVAVSVDSVIYQDFLVETENGPVTVSIPMVWAPDTTSYAHLSLATDAELIHEAKPAFTMEVTAEVLQQRDRPLRAGYNMGQNFLAYKGFGAQFTNEGTPTPFYYELPLEWTTQDSWDQVDFNLGWAMEARAVRRDFNLSYMEANTSPKEFDLAYTHQFDIEYTHFTWGYAVERPLTAGFSLKSPYGVTAGLRVAYSMLEVVRGGGSIQTPLRASVVSGVELSAAMAGVLSGVSLDLSLNRVVANGGSFEAPFMFSALAGRSFSADLRDTIVAGGDLTWDFLTVDQVRAEWVGSALLFDDAPVVQATAFSIVVTPGAGAGSGSGSPTPVEVELESGDVSADEGNTGWAGSFNLARYEDLALFSPRSKFDLMVGGELYRFVVTYRSGQRNSPSGVVPVVKGVSPAVQLTATHHKTITKTWDQSTTAHDIINEMMAYAATVAVPFAFENRLINWPIPANRFAVTNSAPLDVVRQLVQAVGGVLDSQPDGTLVLRPKFPVSVPLWSSSRDLSLSDMEDVFSISDEFSAALVYNKFRVMDSQSVNSGDKLEYEEVDPGLGWVRAYPSPWRESVELVPTNFAASASFVEVEYRDEEETVQVYNGAGSVRFPVVSVNSVTWLDVDLMGVVAGSDSASFTTTHPTEKFSMVRINYRTRCLKFRVAGALGSSVQYLLRNLDGQ